MGDRRLVFVTAHLAEAHVSPRCALEGDRSHRDLPDFAGRKCAGFFSGDVSDEAKKEHFQPSEIELAKSEAVSQESLGRSPRNSALKKSIALKARFNPDRRSAI
jgi:hypothetical protein